MTDSTTAMTQSTALIVRTPADRQLAADLFDAIRAFRKTSEEQKEAVIRPLKDAYDTAKKPFDSFEKECQGHEKTLTEKMGAWDREQDRLAREEQARIQAKIDAENAKRIAKAEAKGQDVSEVALKIAPIVPAPPKNIETQAGTTIGRRTVTRYQVRGIRPEVLIHAGFPEVTQLLADYPRLFVLNLAALNTLAKTGLLNGHPCIEMVEEFSYTQRR